MDSFFEILIIFVIIISILNAIFGKKKNQPNKSQNASGPVPHERKPQSVDILGQLFGIPSQQKKPGFEHDNQDYKTWDPEAEYSQPTKETMRSQRPESAFETRKPARVDVNYDKRKSLKSTPLQSKHKVLINSESETTKRYNKKQIELIKKLRDPKTLRDYILVSEILSKPIALKD